MISTTGRVLKVYVNMKQKAYVHGVVLTRPQNRQGMSGEDAIHENTQVSVAQPTECNTHKTENYLCLCLYKHHWSLSVWYWSMPVEHRLGSHSLPHTEESAKTRSRIFLFIDTVRQKPTPQNITLTTVMRLTVKQPTRGWFGPLSPPLSHTTEPLIHSRLNKASTIARTNIGWTCMQSYISSTRSTTAIIIWYSYTSHFGITDIFPVDSWDYDWEWPQNTA